MTSEERIAKLEEDVKVIAQVASATADDNLRVCFLLRELEQAGYLPELPWDLASRQVELAHAKQAKEHGDPPRNGIPVDAVIAELEKRIRALREQFLKTAHEQER